MQPSIEQLSADELKSLFTKETSRFMAGLDNGLPFDSLKEIRIHMRVIEEELKRREPAHSSADKP